MDLVRSIDVEYSPYQNDPIDFEFVSNPSIKKEANLVLIEGRKSGKPGLKTDAPLIVYQEKGEYTQEIYDIYGMTKPK